MISKVEILGSQLERAEKVYNFAASGFLLALWLTVLGIWTQPVYPGPDPECSFLASKSKVIRESQDFMVTK